MTAYYNEIEPFAADWLENLIAAGHIAPGAVDRRDIRDVRPADLDGYTQCHFFAGIGVWSYALRRAGWSDDRPVWTGSCPCQPFSVAGKGLADADPRHLWPAWRRLVDECSPAILFGEQVDRAIGWGWLDLVSTDLEGAGYAVGAAVFPAAGVGAPHRRQRLFLVAHPNDAERRPSEPARHDRDRAPAGRNEGQRHPWERLHGADWRGYVSEFSEGAHGSSARVGRLRAYGNAIVAEAAQAFIEAAQDAIFDAYSVEN